MNSTDPKITAGALHELDAEEQVQFENDMARDPQLRKEVEAIRTMAGQLTAGFLSEPELSLTDTQRTNLISNSAAMAQRNAETAGVIVFGYWKWAAAALAACLALALIVFELNRNVASRNRLASNQPDSTSPSEGQVLPQVENTPAQAARKEAKPIAPAANAKAPAISNKQAQLARAEATASGTAQLKAGTPPDVNVPPMTDRTAAVEKDTAPPAPQPQVALELVPLPLALPIPAFMGTPTDIAITEHIEKPSETPRALFLAPKGVVNIARNKKVISSDPSPVCGTMDLVTDGDKESNDNSYVEMHRKLQWIQIDLEARFAIYAIVVWHSHNTPQIYHDVVIQTADDADFTANVHTVYNNDYDNTSGLGAGSDKEYFESYEGRLIDAKGVSGRYVRLYSKGSTFSALNRYTEVEVYGLPSVTESQSQ